MLHGAVLSVFALYIAWVHVVLGQARVVAPLQSAGLADFPRSTLFVVWHMASFMLLGTAVTLAYLTVRPDAPLRMFLATELAFGAAAFLVRAQLVHGAGFALPQWILLGPLALCVAWPHGGATLTLLLLALLHVAWVLGLAFPAPSRKQASLYLIGLKKGARMPGGFATLVVAVVLCAMAYAALNGPRVASLLVGSILLGRGLFGFVEARLRPEIAKTPYRLLSRAFYSPLCLLLGGVILADA